MTLHWTRIPRLLTAVVVLTLVLAALTFGARPAYALTTLLYDLDFSSPTHVLGSPPTTGAGPAPRDTVSSIPFGTPTVVSSFGSLTDQPLEFNSFDGAGDQIRLALDDVILGTMYTIETEVEIADVVAPFRPFGVIIDGLPGIRRVDFHSDNTIRAFASFTPPIPILGTYAFNTKIDLKIQVDLTADTWEIFIDGVSTHSGVYGGAAAIKAVRFSTDVISPPGASSTAIDNVRVTIGPFSTPVIPVSIDIKPGSDPNSINCNYERKMIAVAILTTSDFDATTVNHTTVDFEGASEAHVDKKSGDPRRHEEDVDNDGDIDLVLHFRLGDTELTCASTAGNLTGETFGGEAIEGSDAVRMVGG